MSRLCQGQVEIWHRNWSSKWLLLQISHFSPSNSYPFLEIGKNKTRKKWDVFFSNWHFLCWGCVDQRQNVAEWVPKNQCINLTNSGSLDPDRFPKISNPYTKQKLCVYDSYCHSQERKDHITCQGRLNSLYWVCVNPCFFGGWRLMTLSPINYMGNKWEF